MNEIQKFKKGRMIPKHQDGGGIYSASDLVEAGNRAFGQALYYDKRTGDLVQIASKDALTRDGKVKGEVVRTGAEMQSRPYSVFNITGWKTIGPYQGQKKRTLTGKTHINEKEEIAELNRLNPAGQRGANTGVRTGKPAARSKVTPKGQQYWDSQYQDFLGKMTDDQKAWLAQRGIDYGSAEQMQNYLMRIGKNVGKFGADNKWGKDSQAAWDELVNTTMKDNPLQKPAPEPVVDSPDLSQPGTFNTDMTFNKDNIRANRGVNYSDVDQLWDYIGSHGESTEARLFNNVLGGLEGDAKKNAFMQMMDKYKVSGNLGRRDSGRLATMFNDLNLIGTKGTAARQSYVNSFNSSFNKAQQENADARMDAARQQYAAKMAQQYTEQNPVQLTAPKKFTIGSGIGASTLGNAGAGSMTELNLDDMSPREKFAMGL